MTTGVKNGLCFRRSKKDTEKISFKSLGVTPKQYNHIYERLVGVYNVGSTGKGVDTFDLDKQVIAIIKVLK